VIGKDYTHTGKIKWNINPPVLMDTIDLVNMSYSILRV